MRRTVTLLKETLKLTFFTRPNCSLCVDAKSVMSQVYDRRPFNYEEINVMSKGQTMWKELYEFDTPVVSMLCLGGEPAIAKIPQGPRRPK
jgi:glutaredoxin